MKICVSGAGGMIGGFMVKSLLDDGHEVVAVDIKPLREWQQLDQRATNKSIDCSTLEGARRAVDRCERVYNFAADMGGMGYLNASRVQTLHSVDITSNMIRASYESGVKRFAFASSACVYPDYKQQSELVSLKESDAWPADPEPAYGMEKLMGEEFCRWYYNQYGFETRVMRYHNIYSGGPTTFEGGREKAPAAIARKVAEAVLSGSNKIEIWGDGEQTRSFCWIDDCIKGTKLLMDSDFRDPLNIGSSELVTINQLVDIVESIAGVKLEREYDLSKPQGVRGRNSDNTLCKEVLGWEPSTPLREGMEHLYKWVYDQLSER